MVPRRSSVRSMDITGVMPLPPVQNRILAGGGSGSTNSPWGSARRTMVPGSRPRTRCSDRNPSGIALTVIVSWPRRPSRAAIGGGGADGIGAPVPLAVEVHADADVLAGLVAEVPTPAGLDDQGGGVAGLGDDLDDLPPQLAGRPQRIHHVQVVVRQQGSGHAGDDAPDDLGRRALDQCRVREPRPQTGRYRLAPGPTHLGENTHDRLRAVGIVICYCP